MLSKWDNMTETSKREYLDNRREYLGRECTLDGKPAKIVFNQHSGFFAVAILAGGLSLEWSFNAIANTIDNHAGQFAT